MILPQQPRPDTCLDDPSRCEKQLAFSCHPFRFPCQANTSTGWQKTDPCVFFPQGNNGFLITMKQNLFIESLKIDWHNSTRRNGEVNVLLATSRSFDFCNKIQLDGKFPWLGKPDFIDRLFPGSGKPYLVVITLRNLDKCSTPTQQGQLGLGISHVGRCRQLERNRLAIAIDCPTQCCFQQLHRIRRRTVTHQGQTDLPAGGRLKTTAFSFTGKQHKTFNRFQCSTNTWSIFKRHSGIKSNTCTGPKMSEVHGGRQTVFWRPDLDNRLQVCRSLFELQIQKPLITTLSD